MKYNPQPFFDSLIDKLFLWAIPEYVKPNWLSYARIISVPFVFFYLTSGKYVVGFTLFILAASTDFLDGAMARKRNQITYLGSVLDPIADKFLIGTALAAIAFEYILVKVFLVFIFSEIIGVVTGAALRNSLGESKGANSYGKIKMILQTLSVLIFLFSLLMGSDDIRYIANALLFIALFFAVLSAYGQVSDRLIHFVRSIRKKKGTIK